VEYNSVLAGPDDRADFEMAVWNWVIEQTGCDEFRLDGFDTPSVERFLAANPRAVVNRRPSHYFDLTSTRQQGAEPLSRLGVRTRSNIRRALRQLGDVRGEWAETPNHAEKLFQPMVELHQQRWNAAGYPGVYSSRRFYDFHLDLLNRAVPLGLMTIFGVTAGSRLIGCAQVLIDDRRALLYQCGRSAATGNVSYGLALDYLCICDAGRRGYDAVDFLAGDGDHKRRLSTNKAELAWVVWRRSNFKNAAIDAMRCIKRVSTDISRSVSWKPRLSNRTTNDAALSRESKE
jgi:CelD/BcsL family acetyltransferase involved in cellulose biosynthesis